uniref:Anoctamin n=1 Tax=Romanomermis culicivorax TaxID=13658 RepID=A0A915KR12_ROMCU
WIYEKIAHRLTEVECPRTQNDYLTSYIWKVFIFELLNNFAPIFYAALLRGRILIEPSQQSYLQEMCDPGGCLNEVVQAISILLLARLLISNLAEIGFPHLKSIWKDMRLTTGGLVVPDNALTDDPNYVTHVPWWHKDYVLNDPKLDGVYAEFLEMMVQFGYVTLFVAAFPLAPLICLVNNLVEIRLDAINFVTAFRRPLPVRVPGILIWRRCLNIIIKLAVLCNGGFLAMTSEIIPQMIYRYFYSPDKSLNGYVEFFLSKYNVSDWPDFQREYPGVEYCYFRDFKAYKIVWWQIMVARLTFFTLFILFFYFFQWVCEFLINDLPESVKMQLEKEKFLQRQTFYGREIKIDPSSATPTRRPSRITQDEFPFFNNDNRMSVESKTVADNKDQQQNDPTVVCDLRCYSVSDLHNRNNGRYFRRDDSTNSNV